MAICRIQKPESLVLILSGDRDFCQIKRQGLAFQPDWGIDAIPEDVVC